MTVQAPGATRIDVAPAGPLDRIEQGLGEWFTATARDELAGLTAFIATRSS